MTKYRFSYQYFSMIESMPATHEFVANDDLAARAECIRHLREVKNLTYAKNGTYELVAFRKVDVKL